MKHNLSRLFEYVTAVPLPLGSARVRLLRYDTCSPRFVLCVLKSANIRDPVALLKVRVWDEA